MMADMMATRLLLIVGLALPALLGWAGGGPTGFVVLYNPDDPVSLAVANHYQQVRGIPEGNMLPLTLPASPPRPTRSRR